MISKDNLEKDFLEVTKDFKNLLYDISITSPSKKSRFHKQSKEFYKKDEDISDKIQSVIVWSVFTDVAADYFYSSSILPSIFHYLNKKYEKDDIEFFWDDYCFDRKQYALRSGVGKLSKPSIVFHKNYGLNCKFELLFCNTKLYDMVTVEDTLLYENCIGCNAPCEKKCPMNCKMDFKLVDWEKCSNFIDKEYLFENPDKMCRICQESCPYSEELRNQIKKKINVMENFWTLDIKS